VRCENLWALGESHLPNIDGLLRILLHLSFAPKDGAGKRLTYGGMRADVDGYHAAVAAAKTTAFPTDGTTEFHFDMASGLFGSIPSLETKPVGLVFELALEIEPFAQQRQLYHAAHAMLAPRTLGELRDDCLPWKG